MIRVTKEGDGKIIVKTVLFTEEVNGEERVVNTKVYDSIAEIDTRIAMLEEEKSTDGIDRRINELDVEIAYFNEIKTFLET